MSRNEKHEVVIIGICSDAGKLVEAWKVLRALFSDYAGEVMKAFALEEPWQLPAPESIESQITSIEEAVQRSNIPPKSLNTEGYRRPQRVRMHYNYIPRPLRNQPYQRRAY